jgi:hypothetical protein
VAWEDELFDYLEDLEGQAGALFAADRAPELEDRSRSEYHSVSLAARLMASLGGELTLEVVGPGSVTGTLARVAEGWCLLRGPGGDWVVRLEAVAAVHGTSDRAVPEVAWPVASRLGLGAALRRLADAAEPCLVHLADGRRHEGVLRRVGADFVELAAGDAGRLVLVRLAQVSAIQSPG